MKKKLRPLERRDILGIACGVLIVLIAVVSLLLANAGSEAGVSDKDIPAEAQTLYGTAAGRNGDVNVMVVATQDKIYKIKIVEHEETKNIGTKAVSKLPGEIYKNNSLHVDGVTGATLTSNAIKEAVYNALESGGINPAHFGGSRVKVETVALKAETGSPVTVKLSADWAQEYPEVYASWKANEENSEATDYLADYPMLTTLYNGYGFAKDYKAARGHMFDVTDVTGTGRPHPNASCFTCKTPQFTAKVLELGDAAYAIPFTEMQESVNEPISCFNCHANEPGVVTVTHTYLVDGVGKDFESIDAENLACGQCHNEYYFNPNNEYKPTTLPHDSLDAMHPDAILAFYNDASNFSSGDVFYDWVHADTGVKQIKVQHPELETYLGEGSQHRDTYTCADCHMATVTEGDKTYRSHTLTSPLDNQELLTSECSKCHEDLAAEVKAVQEETERRTYGIGYQLMFLTNRLAEVKDSPDYTEQELEQIRSLARDAQFYWDFVFVENSEGVHNPKLTAYCLDMAESLCSQALGLFK
ncbi:MAG: ammonia-forming cytochrome c nitrite reductase subunit c552 [Oscillospiraceae bacterium]|nr:ammonia-forming cytochrome c nitrite reductase subunit c552 [Oscillospiraceae bacterium]